MNTVLVVEDSATDTELLTLCLKKDGFVVVSTKSVEEAEAALERQKPDLMILDVILPGQSGFEFCRKVKADPATQGIPVIISSTKDTDLDKTWGNMAGADAYLTKPVDQTELLNTVRQLIRR